LWGGIEIAVSNAFGSRAIRRHASMFTSKKGRKKMERDNEIRAVDTLAAAAMI
jgi:hypothetical protein